MDERRRRLLTGPAAAGALIALHFGLAVAAVSRESPTSDEVAHLAAGWTYWSDGEYGFQPENGNLPQRWGAVPLLPDRSLVMDRTLPEYRSSNVWASARRWLYESGHDSRAMLLKARIAMALTGIAVGILVYLWSRRLWGDVGGILSLAFFVLDPTWLAHDPLVTSDAMASLFLLLSVGSLWRLFQEVSATRLVIAGACAGGLAIAKFSCVLIAPMSLALIGWRLLEREPLRVRLAGGLRVIAGRGRVLVALGAALCAVAGLATAITWGAYGFRYAAFRNDTAVAGQVAFFPASFDALLADEPPMAGTIRVARAHRVLPEAFLFGLTHVLHEAEARRAFLDGEVRVRGWLTFFPRALFMKTPVGLLLAFALGLAVAALALRARGRERAAAVAGFAHLAAPLVVLLAVYWLAALSSHLALGQRHVMVTIPAACILLGGIGPALARRARLAVVACVLLACTAVEVLAVHPHYLAFFNVVAGGPRNGWRHLVDSSLDWGQDLPALGRWLERHAPPGPDRPPVYLSYFGNGEPRVHGIDAIPLHGFSMWQGAPEPLPQRPLTGGIYCISASMLQLYSVPFATEERIEALYATVVRLQGELDSAPEGSEERARVVASLTPAEWTQLAESAQRMVLDRLCRRLRLRDPDDQVGYSILIYRLTDDDVAQALAPLPTGRRR